jgi:hypothetical protein
LLVRPDEAFATAVEEDACPFKPLATDYQVMAASVTKQEPRLNSTSVNEQAGLKQLFNDVSLLIGVTRDGHRLRNLQKLWFQSCLNEWLQVVVNQDLAAGSGVQERLNIEGNSSQCHAAACSE